MNRFLFLCADEWPAIGFPFAKRPERVNRKQLIYRLDLIRPKLFQIPTGSSHSWPLQLTTLTEAALCAAHPTKTTFPK